ncbi:unnamed protein product, partial [Symbiodinium necroappetens]
EWRLGLQGIERESYCWLTHPKEGDIHSKMCSLGRVDPFEVGYACTSIPDHQPEGRAPNQPLSYVWQSAKVLDHAINKVVYIGYEHPSGRAYALARHPKKALIAPKILMDEDLINEKIKGADIPDDVDATYMKSADGTCTYVSWRDVMASKSKGLATVSALVLSFLVPELRDWKVPRSHARTPRLPGSMLFDVFCMAGYDQSSGECHHNLNWQSAATQGISDGTTPCFPQIYPSRVPSEVATRLAKQLTNPYGPDMVLSRWVLHTMPCFKMLLAPVYLALDAWYSRR